MARRQGSGEVSAWAEAQPRRRRELEAQQRAWQVAQDEQARAQRAPVRAQARDQREALRAYQQCRDADAAARTRDLDARVIALGRVPAAPPFKLGQLMCEAVIAPFAPGRWHSLW